MAKEEIIFEYQIDMGGALADAERFKRNIIQTKEEQKQLNDAYKKGSISLEEYAADSVRLEAILKKETTTYNDLSKSMTGTKTQTDKLIESNNKLSKANENLGSKFQSVAGNINIAGTNLGSLTSGMTAFLNPVTAAVGIVGALGAAYARSTIGAKDLDFVSNQLSTTVTTLTNRFASLFSSAEDGEGTITKLYDSFVQMVSSSGFGIGLKLIGVDLMEINAQAKQVAMSMEVLEDLGREARGAQADQQDLLGDNAELLEQINREQTSYNDKIFLSGKMVDNIRTGSDAVLSIRRAELVEMEKMLEADVNNEALQGQILDKKFQISQEEKKADKLVNGILRAQENITAAEEKRLIVVSASEEKERLILEHKQAQIDLGSEDIVDSGDAIAAAREKNNEDIASALTTERLTMNTDKLSASILKKAEADKNAANYSAKATAADKDRTGSQLILSNAIGGAATIFEKHTIASRVLSAAQAGINSFLAGTEVLKDPTFIGRPVQRIVAMIATVSAGLAQQAKIFGAFAGGGSFTTKGPAWILVGDNPGGKERVDVTPISGHGKTRIYNDGAAMAGGGSINGSILAASNTAPIDSQFDLSRSLEMPVVNLVYSEYQQFTNKVSYKEQLTTS